MNARAKSAIKPDVDAIFAALADPSRRRAVEILGSGPRRAGELADLLALPAPAMSRHLKELKSAGLIVDSHPEPDARVRVYALNTDRLADLKSWLARAEEGWSHQLSAFAAHVAKRPIAQVAKRQAAHVAKRRKSP